MKEQIQTYVKHCQKCQQSKVSNQKTSGSLIPLPTPSGPWQDVTVDFTKMPESLSYNYILVVVDQFSKEVVFVPALREKPLTALLSYLETMSGVSMDSLILVFKGPVLGPRKDLDQTGPGPFRTETKKDCYLVFFGLSLGLLLTGNI